ncbi:MAG: tetratricopeptide (TPR) repeat protein [Planctomycetota bacterium]|jgi:tetratricopeptide (TPR) repeat protein
MLVPRGKLQSVLRTKFRTTAHLLNVMLLLTACGTSLDNTGWREFTAGREYQLATSLRGDNKEDEARRIFANLRRLEPSNIAALYHEALLTKESTTRASFKEELLGLIDASDNEKLHASYRAALSLIEDDRPTKEQLLNEALTIDSDNCLAHALLSLSLEERGEFELAYQHNLDAAKGLTPPPRVFRKLASYEASKGRRDKAIKYYETYLVFEPEDSVALYNLGTLYLESASWSDAEKHLSTAFELDGQDLDIILNYAKASIENGRYVVAMELLDRAERLNPNDPDIYYNRGVFQAERLSEFSNAIDSFELYLKYKGPEIRRVRGWIEELKSRLEE